MVYVQRDREGRLLRAEQSPFDDMTETLAVDDEELLQWLDAQEKMQLRLAKLRNSDLEMIRVLEDLVTVLVDRGVIRYTDLPEAARRKLHARAETRAELGGLSGLLGDDEGGLI